MTIFLYRSWLLKGVLSGHVILHNFKVKTGSLISVPEHFPRAAIKDTSALGNWTYSISSFFFKQLGNSLHFLTEIPVSFFECYHSIISIIISVKSHLWDMQPLFSSHHIIKVIVNPKLSSQFHVVSNLYDFSVSVEWKTKLFSRLISRSMGKKYRFRTTWRWLDVTFFGWTFPLTAFIFEWTVSLRSNCWY